MDASAVLAAYASQDAGLLLNALPWDAREDIQCPGMGTLVVGRVSTYGVTFSDSTGLMVHDHENEADAVECYTNKISLLRESIGSFVEADFQRFLPDVQSDIEDMTGYVGRHELREEPPRYV